MILRPNPTNIQRGQYESMKAARPRSFFCRSRWLFLLFFTALNPAFLRADDGLSQVVLNVASSRAAAARAAGAMETGKAMEEEVAAMRVKPALISAVPTATELNLSVLRKPLLTEGNPYLERLVAGAKDELSRQDIPWPFATPEKPVFNAANSLVGDFNPRDAANRMEAYLWLFANPASPLHHDPGVLARFLQRAHAYTDAIILQPDNKKGQQIYDDFAMSPASCAVREFAQLYPGLLLPSQKIRWNQAMRLAGDLVMQHTAEHLKSHPKGYANIDITKAFQLLNFGLYLKDEAMLSQSRALVEKVNGAILPDGGTHYIWSQNESCGYHDVISLYLCRIYEITGEPRPLELLKKLEWYGPVSIGRLGEYWTAPSWKHTWNNTLKKLGGGEYVSSATGNPYLRGILGEPDYSAKNFKGWEQAKPKIPWYRKDIPSRELPDKVTYIDRNIEGPRAWYGRFSYAATLRGIPVDEPGHSTLMGAMVLQSDQSMQVFLMGAYPRVRVGDDPQDPRSWAWLTSGMSQTLVMGRHLSACFASYDMAAFRSSQKGPLSGWRGRQIWLGLPGRLVGWLAVDPTDPASTVREVQTVLRLGTGGTANGPKQTVRALGPSEWAYGDLIVRVVAHSPGPVEPKSVPFRLPDYPITEIIHQIPEAGGGWTLVEIRPSWSPAAEIRHSPSSTGPLEFTVIDGEKSFYLAANNTMNPVSWTPPAVQGKASDFVSGTTTPLACAPTLVLPPQGVAIRVKSADAQDHLPAWKTYQEMIASEKPSSEAASTLSPAGNGPSGILP